MNLFIHSSLGNLPHAVVFVSLLYSYYFSTCFHNSMERVVDSMERVVDSMERVVDSMERVVDSMERVVDSMERVVDSMERDS